MTNFVKTFLLVSALLIVLFGFTFLAIHQLIISDMEIEKFINQVRR